MTGGVIHGMYNTNYKFPEGARVRLRLDVDPSIYGDFARVGNEGIIAVQDKDRFGLPEVYVKWDMNHWAYNGVQDCWTFEDHFELVEEVEDDNMSKDSKERKLAAMFQEMARVMGEDGDDESPPQPQPQASRLTERFRGAASGFKHATMQERQENENEEFVNAANAATERLLESEAFVIIGVKRVGHPGTPDGVLEPFALGYSKTDEGDILVTAHMNSVAARAHQELALQTITQIVADK